MFEAPGGINNMTPDNRPTLGVGPLPEYSEGTDGPEAGQGRPLSVFEQDYKDIMDPRTSPRYREQLIDKRNAMVDRYEQNGVMNLVRRKTIETLRNSTEANVRTNLAIAAEEIEEELKNNPNRNQVYFPSTFGLGKAAIESVSQDIFANKVAQTSDAVLRTHGIDKQEEIDKSDRMRFWDSKINVQQEIGRNQRGNQQQQPRNPNVQQHRQEGIVRDLNELAGFPPEIQVRLQRLQLTAENNVLSAEDWARHYDRLLDLAEQHNVPLGLIAPFADRITEQVRRLGNQQPARQQNQGGGNETIDLLRQIAQETAAQRQAQESMYRLSIRSYDDFINQEAYRAPIHPLNLLQERPHWFRQLETWQQNVVGFRSRITYAARAKQEQGPLNLDVSVRPEFMEWPSKEWDEMWLRVPGHRIGIVTMMHDLFEPNRDHLVLKPETIANILPNFNDYLSHRIGLLKQYYINNPHLMDSGNWPVTGSIEQRAEEYATSGFWSAANMLFVGGAVESGDEGRKVRAGKHVFSEQFRAMMRPLDKALNKYIKPEDEQATVEGWGGPWGEWYAQGAAYVPGFRDLFDTDNPSASRGPRYLPERLYYSIFDLALLDKGPFERNKKSFSEAMMYLQPINLGGGLKDIDPRQIRPGYLKDNDLWGQTYADLMDSVTKVYLFLTGKADRDFNPNQLADALSKLRGNRTLEKFYTDEQLVTSAVVMLAGGPLLGCYEPDGKILVNYPAEPDAGYDSNVNAALRNPRIIGGMPEGFRHKVLRRLYATDRNDTSIRADLLDFAKTLNPLDDRKAVYRRAIKRQAEMSDNVRPRHPRNRNNP